MLRDVSPHPTVYRSSWGVDDAPARLAAPAHVYGPVNDSPFWRGPDFVGFQRLNHRLDQLFARRHLLVVNALE